MLDPRSVYPEGVKVSEKDKALVEFMIEEGISNPQAIKASLMEQNITHESLGLIMVQNGFLSHDELIEATLRISDDALMDEELIIPYLPHKLLLDNQAMVMAETITTVYMATMLEQNEVRYKFEEYFPTQSIKFVPCNIERLENYHSKLFKIHSSDQSILEKMLRKAIMYGASDIHIVPRRRTYSLFMRVLGVRHHDHEGDMDEYNKIVSMIKDKSKMDLAERRVNQDGSYTIEYNGRYIDLRVATLPLKMGEGIIMRILDPAKTNVKLRALGISNVPDWEKAITLGDGIILICGTTGSGKTTTLTATLREMDRFGKAIYTAEDPVEYNQNFIGQVNINAAVGLDYSSTVRAFMRSDPDIIIIGEIRDLDTARNAIKAAETGHLVIATMHTQSILGSISRLRDLGVAAHEIRYILRCVLAQKLIRTICKKCEGKGCTSCLQTGYGSRTIVSECKYFKNDTEVENLIQRAKPTWKTLLEDAYDKCEEGLTDLNELRRVFGEDINELVEEIAQSRLDARASTDNIVDSEE
jgi:type II secretory ATPase GspE/PulE/Tfp pilus assembly ATPase PilB-like protein